MLTVGDYNFFYRKRNENQLGTGFSVHHRILLAVKRVKFANDRMSFTDIKKKKKKGISES